MKLNFTPQKVDKRLTPAVKDRKRQKIKTSKGMSIYPMYSIVKSKTTKTQQ